MTLELNTIHQGNNVDLLKKLPDECIDLTVTSPPYDNIRNYNGYSFDFESLAKELYRVTNDGGVVVWIVNDSTVKGSETLTSFKQALYFKEIGFNVHDTMVWQKISPFQHKNRYIASFEYMFVLSKGKPKTANIIKDRKNKWAGTKVHGTLRQDASGELKEINGKNKREIKEYGSRFNIWKMAGDKTNKTGHPAVFPVNLVQDHIITWSNEGDIVLDPFMGSGTTAIACINENRNWIGMEISQEYISIANKRLELHKSTTN